MHYFLCSLIAPNIIHTCGDRLAFKFLMTLRVNTFRLINFQLIQCGFVCVCMSVRRLKIQVSVLYVLSLISLVSVSLAVTLLSPYHLVFCFVFLFFKLFITILRFFYLIKFALSNYNYNFINNHLN